MHELHDIDDEPSAPEFFDFGFEKEKDVSKIRQLVVQEVFSFVFFFLDVWFKRCFFLTSNL
jgi:hypothetical protein